ncbi:MAG TPA: hypothetical protein VHD33_02845 [Legionellaceae bacterium]|nr:hypothetical protein [Legionellaceae bacterium]
MIDERTALNRDEEKIVKEIHDLCMDYMQQPRPVILDEKKIQILFELISCQSASSILYKLNYDKVYHSIYGREVTYATTLGLTDTPPLLWYLFLLLTSLSFPLSIPAMMLYSWTTRGTLNFLKTEGTLLIERITVLCKESEALIAAQPSKKTSIQTYPPYPRANYMHNKVKQNYTNTGEAKQPDQIDQTQAPFSVMTNALGQFAVGAFQQMELYHLINDAGTPVITSYRINPKEFATSQQFSIDIRSKFMWTYAASMRVRIALFTKFTMPLDFQTDQHKPLPHPTRPSSTENTWYTLSFLYKKESLDDFINKAENTQDIDAKEHLLLQALSIAKNPREQTKVLEALVNTYGNYYDSCKSSFIRSHNTDSMFRDICMPRAEKKMSSYAAQLPLNFRSLSANAFQLDIDYQEICALTQSNIEEAWAKYRVLPELTPFIKRLFPNLEAMNYQLKIIFTLSRHLGSPSTGAMGLGGFIPEHSIIGLILADFEKMLVLINSFNPDLKQQIEEHSVAPIRTLIAAGKVAKNQTKMAVRNEIHQQEVVKIHELLLEHKNFTYRRLNEDMDDDVELLGTQRGVTV